MHGLMDGHGMTHCVSPSHEGHHHETDLSLQRPTSPPQNVSHLKAIFGPMVGGLSQRRFDTKIISVLFLISRSKSDAWKSARMKPAVFEDQTSSSTLSLQSCVRPLLGMLNLEEQLGKHELKPSSRCLICCSLWPRFESCFVFLFFYELDQKLHSDFALYSFLIGIFLKNKPEQTCAVAVDYASNTKS